MAPLPVRERVARAGLCGGLQPRPVLCQPLGVIGEERVGVDVGVGTDAEVATSDAVVDAYLREHPELAAQVDKEMMMHFRRFVERFGVPALA